MCDTHEGQSNSQVRTIPIADAVGTVLAHDVTEITPGTFKGRAFKKGHIIREEDICHLQRLGKEKLFVLDIAHDEMHEDAAACLLAEALMGEGVRLSGLPKEGKINLIAERAGLLRVNRFALREFNLLGDVMCATLHDNTVVREGQIIAGTRAIPLVVKRDIIERAVRTTGAEQPVIAVKEIRKPRAGVVITGNEVYYGRVQDSFAPVIKKKIEMYGGEIKGVYFAPDDESYIEDRLRELINAGCDLLITTGGMSVDPDDITRFAIRNLGAHDITYGAPVLPGSMVLVAYIAMSKEQGAENLTIEAKDYGRMDANNSSLSTLSSSPIPILGIPACGMYHRTTVFDLLLPRVLAGERIGRTDIAELGHGGLCLLCEECRYPVCPFGKG